MLRTIIKSPTGRTLCCAVLLAGSALAATEAAAKKDWRLPVPQAEAVSQVQLATRGLQRPANRGVTESQRPVQQYEEFAGGPPSWWVRRSRGRN